MSFTHSPRITILTPAFDAERFLDRAFGCVRAQTIADWEWLIVDDCSTDGTARGAEALAAADPRVRLIRAPHNLGPAGARNLGLAAARGDWVAIYDVDDLMEPWRLERLLGVAQASRADIVADNLRIAPEEELAGPGAPFLALRADRGPRLISLEDFLEGNVLFGPPDQTGYLKPMFRRAFLQMFSLAYDERLRIGEDFALVAHALAFGARYVLDPSIGYRYGVRAGSISRVMRPADVEALMASDERLIDRFPELSKGIAHQALRRRRKAFQRGLAYMRAIEALKKRDLFGAAAAILRAPSAAGLLRLPILVRLERLAAARAKAPPPLVAPEARVDPARVIVVIPTLNEERHIEQVLAQLTKGDPRMAQVRIIVADGGSTDQTRARVMRFATTAPNVALIDNPARLQSAGINRAAAAFASGADIMVRCDAHADYPASYVLDVAQALLQRNADSLVVAMDAVGEGCFQRAVAWIVDTPLGAGGAAHRGGKASGPVDHGHHAAFRLDRFLALGGYDETFSHNEDAEYDRRLVAAGGRIFLEAGIRKTYYPRTSARALWRQYRNYGRGRARTLAKHGGAPKLRQMAPVINLGLMASSLAIAPMVPAALAYPGMYFSALAAASILTAAARGSMCGLGAGLALAIIHNAWAIGFLEAAATQVRARRIAPQTQVRPAE